MGFGDAFEQRLALLQIGGGFGDAVAIFGDARFRCRRSRLLLRDRCTFVGSEQLIDKHGKRRAGPCEQDQRGDQRDTFLPEGADTQEPDMAVRANEDFMVLKQRRNTLAQTAQARSFRRQVATPSCCYWSPPPRWERALTGGTQASESLRPESG
jgi:hypothetical protein